MVEMLAPRAIRPVPDQLGLYFRAGYNDHRALIGAIAAGRRKFLGIVFEAHRVARHRELLDVASKARLECILDPCTQPAATAGGFSSSYSALEWIGERQQKRGDFVGNSLRTKAHQIAQFASEQGFSQVLAPTHYSMRGNGEWHEIDLDSTRELRHALDAIGRKDIGVIYPLTISYLTLRQEDARLQAIEGIDGLPINSVWVRVDPFGSDSTGAAVRNFVEASCDFHRLGVPIIADQVGGLVGLSLLATSAVGGLSHGITMKERFNAGTWRKMKDGKGYMPSHRVYVQALDLYFDVSHARRIFDASDRIKGHFGCSDSSCCPRGIADMLENPAGHFLTQRMRQVDLLATAPETLRAKQFLDHLVRPTADAAIRMSSSRALNEEEKLKLERHRKRLDLLRISLEDLVESARDRSVSPRPIARVARENRLGR